MLRADVRVENQLKQPIESFARGGRTNKKG